jgi:hypothetical protein
MNALVERTGQKKVGFEQEEEPYKNKRGVTKTGHPSLDPLNRDPCAEPGSISPKTLQKHVCTQFFENVPIGDSLCYALIPGII